MDREKEIKKIVDWYAQHGLKDVQLNTSAIDVETPKVMTGVLLHFARIANATDYGDDAQREWADEGNRYLLNNILAAVKMYDDYIAGLKAIPAGNYTANGADQIDRLQAEMNKLLRYIKEEIALEQAQDKADNDEISYWRVTDQDGKSFDVALDDDGVLDIGVSLLRHADIDGAYVVVVNDAVTGEERIVGVYFDREEAESAADDIEKFGVSRNDRAMSALEFLRNGGESIDPKTARELRGVTALEYLNGEY